MAQDQWKTQQAVAGAFGRLLRRWRRERGLSQERLAELSGCDRSYLSRLERGVNAPSLTVAVELGRAFGLAPSELFAQAGAEIEQALSASERPTE